MTKYIVRQYRPAYCSGFEDAVIRGVMHEDLLDIPFMKNFRHSNFTHFTIKPYCGNELIISAHYADGKQWVVGFALPEDSSDTAPGGGLLRDNWRYKQSVPPSVLA